MKFSRKLKSILFFTLVLVMLFSSVVLADNVPPLTTTAEGEAGIMLVDENLETTSNVVSKTLYLANSSVIIDYPVEGNVFVMAQDLTISGNISGNVFALAQNLKIETTGSINSTLFVCAENVTIDGTVSDVFSISSNLTINNNARVMQDITAGGNTLKLGGTIGRNANFGFDEIYVSDSAVILGDLSYSSRAAAISEDIVSGTTSFKPIEEVKIEPKDIIKEKLNDLYTLLVVSLVIVLIVVYAMPKFADKEQKIVENKLTATFGYGALALILVPFVCLLLFCTILGILPAVALFLVYLFITMQVATPLVAIAIAKIICQKINKNTKGFTLLFSMLLVLAIWVLKLIPVLGGIASLLTAILGLGIIVYAIFHSTIEPKKDSKKDDKIVAEASAIIENNGKDEENK